MKRKKQPSEAPPPKSDDVPLSGLASRMGLMPRAEPSDNFLIAALGASDLRKLLAEILPESKKIEDYEVEHDFPKLGRRTMLLNGRRVEQRDGKESLLLLAIEDVTERKRAEDIVRTNAAELSRLARGMVGRELRMIEMKKEVNELCHRLGEVVRYPLEFEQDGREGPGSPQTRNQP
jgi:hypothetical protein